MSERSLRGRRRSDCAQNGWRTPPVRMQGRPLLGLLKGRAAWHSLPPCGGRWGVVRRGTSGATWLDPTPDPSPQGPTRGRGGVCGTTPALSSPNGAASWSLPIRDAMDSLADSLAKSPGAGRPQTSPRQRSMLADLGTRFRVRTTTAPMPPASPPRSAPGCSPP
jgi:hypothetical protein